MRPYLIFDYDGTIHNTLRIYLPALRKTFRLLQQEEGISVPGVSAEQAASSLGLNVRDIWNSFLPGQPEAVKQKASALTGEAMAEQVRSRQAAWYPGVREALDCLKEQGFRMSVLSNCQRSYRDLHWDAFKMARWFDAFYDCESFGYAPKSEIILELGRSLPPPFVVIGDRNSDLDCARASGSPFIGCLYGFGAPEEFSGADRLIRLPEELPAALASLSADTLS